MRTKKYCHFKSDIPTVEHFAIIEFRSFMIPGDERSQTNPGHGYPESTEQLCDYISFTDREEWEFDIADRMRRMRSQYSSKEFVALKVTPAEIQTTYSVKVN